MVEGHFPRLIGFEVPPLQVQVDVIRDAPVVALLDTVPSRSWVEAFEREVAALGAELAATEVTVEGDRVMFFASHGDGRRLAQAIRALVEKTTRRAQDDRLEGRAPSPGSSMDPASPPPGAASGTVLVVEDDELLRATACEFLAAAGWVTVEADNAAKAVTLLEQFPTRFDVVFTDVDMPGAMDGIGLAHHVRARYPDMGLVVTSGRYTLDAGRLPPGCAFLSKPYQRRQLLALLDLAVRQDNDTPASPMP